MEGTKLRTYPVVLDALLSPKEDERAAAAKEIRLASVRKAESFADDFSAALKAHKQKNKLLPLIVGMLKDPGACPALRRAAMLACDAEQLGAFALDFITSANLEKVDSRKDFGAAIVAMEKPHPQDQVLAIERLAGLAEQSKKAWATWLYDLATGLKNPHKWAALAAVARNVGDKLTDLQWSAIVEAAVAAEVTSSLDDRGLLLFVQGLRRCHRVRGVKDPFDLTREQWDRIFKLLVTKRQQDAVNHLLACGPGSFLPANLAAVLTAGVAESWKQESVVASPRSRPSVREMLTPRKKKTDPVASETPLFVDLLGMHGVAARIALAFMIQFEQDQRHLFNLLNELETRFKDSAGAALESVDVVVALADCELDLQTSLHDNLQMRLFTFVDSTLYIAFHQLQRPKSDPPDEAIIKVVRSNLTQAAGAVARMIWRRRKISLSQCHMLTKWAGGTTDEVRLHAVCCVLAFGPNEPADKMPALATWDSALDIALKTDQRDCFTLTVLKWIGHPQRQAPDKVLAQALEWADAQTELGISAGTLWEQALGRGFVKVYEPILSKFIHQDDVMQAIEVMLTLAQAEPDPWTSKKALFTPLFKRADACLTLITLTRRLYEQRCPTQAAWTMLIEWAELLAGGNRQLARLALAFALQGGSAWCAVLTPKEWNLDVGALIERHDAGSWLACMNLVKRVPGALGMLFENTFLKALVSPRLALADLPPIDKARKALQAQFPSINWPCVLLAGADAQQRALVARPVCSDGRLDSVFGSWVTSLREFAEQLIASKAVDRKALQEHLQPVLAACLPEADAHRGDPATRELVKLIFGTRDAPAFVHVRLLDAFVEPLAPDAPDLGVLQFKAGFDHHLLTLLDLAQKAGVDAACVEAFHAAHASLKALIASPAYVPAFAGIQYLRIELLDTGDTASLLLPQLLAVPVTNARAWACELLTELAGPYLQVVVRDESGDVVASLGCALVQLQAEAHQPARVSLLCERFISHPRLEFWSDDMPIALALGPALLEAVQALAARLGVDRILVRPDCFFAPSAWPLTLLHGTPLSSSPAWRAVLGDTDQASQADGIISFEVRTQPPAPQ